MPPGLRRTIIDAINFWMFAKAHPLNNMRDSPIVITWRGREYLLKATSHEC